VKTFAKVPDDGDAAARFAGEGSAPEGEDLPEIVDAYQSRGAKAAQRAAHFAREWETLKTHGGGMTTTQENYVHVNMVREGFKPPKKAAPAK